MEDEAVSPYKNPTIGLQDHPDPAPKGQVPYANIHPFCSVLPHIPMDSLHSQDLRGEGSPRLLHQGPSMSGNGLCLPLQMLLFYSALPACFFKFFIKYMPASADI